MNRRPPPPLQPPPLRSSDDHVQSIALGVLALAVLLLLLLVFSLSQIGNGTGAAVRGSDAVGTEDSTEQDGTRADTSDENSNENKTSNSSTDALEESAGQKQTNALVGTDVGDQSDEEAQPTPNGNSSTSQENSNREMNPEELEKYSANTSSNAGVGLLPVEGTVGFFGMGATGGDVAFIIDISSSMSGTRIDRAKKELIKAIEQLSDDQKFSIYLFNSSLIRNSDFIDCNVSLATITNLRSWLQRTYASGGTNPMPAMEQAFRDGCDEIFLLSDGEFHGGAPAEIKRMNKKKAKINAISLQFQSVSMQQIAKQNNGTYRTVRN